MACFEMTAAILSDGGEPTAMINHHNGQRYSPKEEEYVNGVE